MRERIGAISIGRGLSIGLLALVIAPSHSSVFAQSADLVLCDRIAADPADPDKPTDVKGTPTIAPSDIATAIKFCKTASGSSRRALYELGRAYAANHQLSEAMSAWRRAADKGSTSAMVELGVLLSTGSGGAKEFGRGAQAVRTRRRGRQSAWRNKFGGAGRRRFIGSRQGESLAVESVGDKFGGGGISARADDCGGCRRAAGRCGCARVV